jgi:hypothetical protein
MGSTNSQPIKTTIADQITKIDIPNNFEVKNGVLGLRQNAYLNIIKSLDSLKIRKVY